MINLFLKSILRDMNTSIKGLVIMGIWHGANWTFFWYGVIHGAMVGINRYHNQRRKRLGLPYELKGLKLVWRVAAAFGPGGHCAVDRLADSLPQNPEGRTSLSQAKGVGYICVQEQTKRAPFRSKLCKAPFTGFGSGGFRGSGG